MTIIPIVTGAFGTVTKGLLKGMEDLEVGGEWRQSKRQYYWEPSRRISKMAGKLEDKWNLYRLQIIKISYNTAKRPGELRCFAVIQTPVKNY